MEEGHPLIPMLAGLLIDAERSKIIIRVFLT
jgi:hypothetical protein